MKVASFSRSAPRHSGAVSLIGLAVALALCLGVGALGAVWTADGVRTWYPTLAKPPITPPNWLFGPVWTALYLIMGYAAWRVWRRSGFGGAPAALALFGIQLALNLAWSHLFFGRHSIGTAFVEILALLAAIIATAAAFARTDRVAAWLMIPYIAWVAFASVLTGWIWLLNRGA
jgi:tryptophan-rich sensory protein